MKYMGSKSRIAAEILPIILKDRTPEQYYVEPMVGGSINESGGVGNFDIGSGCIVEQPETTRQRASIGLNIDGYLFNQGFGDGTDIDLGSFLLHGKRGGYGFPLLIGFLGLGCVFSLGMVIPYFLAGLVQSQYTKVQTYQEQPTQYPAAWIEPSHANRR